MIRAAACLAAALLLAAAGPLVPADYAWQPNPGAAVPMATVLHDEAGRALTLAAAADGRAIVLDIGYYHCPTLCGVVRADLINALNTSGLVAGRDYSLVVLSIDPVETPADAADAKRTDLLAAPPGAAAGWHYLTGDAAGIAGIAAAVGFRSRYDPDFRQFLHPAGLVVLAPSGRVSSYVGGVGYNGGEVRAAVLWAGEGGVAAASLPILLLCFHFDSTTGRYTLAIEKLLRLFAGLTVVTLGGLWLALNRKPRAAR